MPHDPSFAGIYGALKDGKTSEALAAFPTAAYVAAPGALAPAEEVWGFPQPKSVDLETFKDVREYATKLNPKPIALVVDDATLIADRTVNSYKAKGIDGYALWGAVLTSAVRLRDDLRRRGMHIVFTLHAIGAEVKDGVRLKGGPSFPGQARVKLPAAFDLLLRVEDRPGGLGWPKCYRVGPHPDWLQGSRFNTPDPAPMNLGEILRSVGYQIPRYPGLEWQEKLAAALCDQLLKAPGLGDSAHVAACMAKVRDFALAKCTKNLAQAYWAVRDGYDRAVLKVANDSKWKSLWNLA